MKLYWVTSPSELDYCSYLWVSEDEEGTEWGGTNILSGRIVDKRLKANTVSLAEQKSRFPKDTFTLIGEGTYEECVAQAKLNKLIGVGE